MKYESPEKMSEYSTTKLLAYKSTLEECTQKSPKWQETYDACLRILAGRKRPRKTTWRNRYRHNMKQFPS